jgi:PAS domain S-box-containing protein
MHDPRSPPLPFELICSALPQLVVVYDLGLGRTVYINQPAPAILPPDGTPALPADAGDLLLQRVHPDDRSRVHARLQRAGALADGGQARHEFRFLGADGLWHWQEAHDSVLRRHPDGRAWQLLCSAVQIDERKRSEASALESRRLLDEMEKAPMAVVEFDLDDERVVRRWAGDAERLFGWTAAEALGRPLRTLDLVHPDDLQGVRSMLQALLRGRASHATWTNRNLDRQRRLLHCTWHNSVIPAADGGRGTVLSLVLDITGHQRAEQALLASEQRHRLLAETLQHGVVHQDASGRIIAMNPAAERILGKTRERFLGSDSVQEAHDTVREDGSPFPGDEHPSMVALKTGRPVQGVVMGVWNPQRGERRWLRVGAVPVPAPMLSRGHDAPAEVYGLFEDITEQRAAAEALRRSTERFELALAGSQITVMQLDLQLRYTWLYNPQYAALVPGMLGRTDEELLADPAEGRALMAVKQQAIDTGQGLRQVVRLHLFGDPRDYDLRVEPQRDAAGRTVGVLCAAIDITDRQRTERALREADRHKDLFIATLAHELRNPLAPIHNVAVLLRNRHGGGPQPGPHVPDADSLRWAGVIERQTAQMARLLDDLLDVARVASGRLLLRPERLPLSAVIEQAVETARPLIEAAGHALELQLPAEAVALQGDRVRLAQVCANLLANAAKYTPAGGRIVVTAGLEPAGADAAAGSSVQGNGSSNGDIVIRVRDSGIGLAPEHLHSVFEMFGQVDTTAERTQGGMGIGLALARGLVQMHGGSISAHSAGPGQGSEFVVRLPAPGTPPPAPAVVPVPADAAARGLRVLVVDDNVDAAQTLALLLTVDGHCVETASDGIEALACAELWQPDVALLDLGMPRMNGYDLCRALRDRPGGDRLLAVAVSGWGQEQDRQRSAAAGFDAHLVKPVHYEQLVALLAQAMAPL